MSAATPIKMFPIINDTPQENTQENFFTGHVKIYRSLKKHWLWKASRKKSKLEAWLDLLMLAAYEDTKEPFGYDLIMLKRGQLLTSQDKLSKDWFWDRSAVRLFLKQLEDDGMIQVNATSKYTMITICKYASYHSLQPSKQQVNNNKTTSKQHIEELKEFKEEKKEEDTIPAEPVLNVPFEKFWNDYGKKVGKVEDLKKKWAKLKNEEREAIIAYLPEYVKSTPDKKFRKNPQTFLNQKSWNDEIIKTPSNATHSTTPSSGKNAGRDQLLARISEKYNL